MRPNPVLATVGMGLAVLSQHNRELVKDIDGDVCRTLIHRSRGTKSGGFIIKGLGVRTRNAGAAVFICVCTLNHVILIGARHRISQIPSLWSLPAPSFAAKFRYYVRINR